MLTVITGPMFSGKTTELLRRLKRAQCLKRPFTKNVVLVRPDLDTRDTLSHDSNVSWSGKTVICSELTSKEHVSNPHLYHSYFSELLAEYDVIGIDEAQFFPDLIDIYDLYIENSNNTHLIVAGLNLSSECEEFEAMTFIMNHADELVKLNAICSRCGSEYGIFTKYIGDVPKDKILVGGSNLYEARCASCYFSRI